MVNELALLLQEGVIDEVIGGLKTGKEAEVCLVRHGGEVIAAKVYKERHARSFHHNAEYKEGRLVRNTRTQRAMDRGSKFGQAASEEAWKSAEADALYKLHAAGVRVPAPVMFYEGVLLMQLVVDAEGRPAPRLIDAHPTREAAGELYRDLRRQVTTMLCGDLIHGDLSPYNVLMGAAGPTIIDFPQIISAAHNSRAEFFFRRDLENLRVHLAAIDPELANSRGDAAEIWRGFVRRDLSPDFVPSGRPPPEQELRAHGSRGGREGGPRPPRDGQGGQPPRGRQEQHAASPGGNRGEHAGQRHSSRPGGEPGRQRQAQGGPGGGGQQAGQPRHSPQGGRGGGRDHSGQPGHSPQGGRGGGRDHSGQPRHAQDGRGGPDHAGQPRGGRVGGADHSGQTHHSQGGRGGGAPHSGQPQHSSQQRGGPQPGQAAHQGGHPHQRNGQPARPAGGGPTGEHGAGGRQRHRGRRGPEVSYVGQAAPAQAPAAAPRRPAPERPAEPPPSPPGREPG
ncbi:MAG: RIO1 family regulatory kinase/ATPase domain-containing protein [Myxococcaceae bacterium]